jgi:hypothetical protein
MVLNLQKTRDLLRKIRLCTILHQLWWGSKLGFQTHNNWRKMVIKIIRKSQRTLIKSSKHDNNSNFSKGTITVNLFQLFILSKLNCRLKKSQIKSRKFSRHFLPRKTLSFIIIIIQNKTSIIYVFGFQFKSLSYFTLSFLVFFSVISEPSNKSEIKEVNQCELNTKNTTTNN